MAAGGTLNPLSTARELAAYGEVTLAFRRFVDPPPAGPWRIIALGEQESADLGPGKAPRAWGEVPYLRRLSRFAAEHAGRYNVVLEHGWNVTGYLVAAFGRHGVPGAAIVGTLRTGHDPFPSLGHAAQGGVRALQAWLARRCLRAAPRVIAETEAMRDALIRRLGLQPERVAVVGLGVDHALFRPLPQDEARTELGIDPDRLVLLYVGAFDRYHDLRPLFQALGALNHDALEFHIVGEGLVGDRRHRAAYEGMVSRIALPVVFHGTVPHERVASYIAAADLCVAPYNLRAFATGEITSFTLKVPEYMACGRPVATLPSGNLRRLVTHGVSGFLLPNRAEDWSRLLRDIGSRDGLRQMGNAAAEAVRELSWARTAAGYWRVCRELLGIAAEPDAAAAGGEGVA